MYYFPDKNVLIDAAQAVYSVWTECAVLNRLGFGPDLVERFQDRESTQTALKEFHMHDLLRRFEAGEIPLGALQAKAGGKNLRTLLSQEPTPSWLTEVMLGNHDERVRDLAQQSKDGQLVTTTEVMADSQRLLNAKGIPAEAARLLIQGLVKDGEIVEVDLDRRQAIADGRLEEIAELVRAGASENLADIDWEDPWWAVRKELRKNKPGKDPHSTWRDHKIDHPEAYGVDGEDLYLFYQVTLCAQELGAPVTLTTSDYHAAVAAGHAGICPTTLYTHTENGLTVTDILPRRIMLAKRGAAQLHGQAMQVQ